MRLFKLGVITIILIMIASEANACCFFKHKRRHQKTCVTCVTYMHVSQAQVYTNQGCGAQGCGVQMNQYNLIPIYPSIPRPPGKSSPQSMPEIVPKARLEPPR